MKSVGGDKEINETTDRWFGRTIGAKTEEWTEEKIDRTIDNLFVVKTGVKIGKWIVVKIAEKIGSRTDGKIDGLAARLTLPAHVHWHALANMLIKDILKRSRTEYGAVSFKQSKISMITLPWKTRLGGCKLLVLAQSLQEKKS